MDVIERERIKVPNAVLISGFSGTETDEEVVTFCNTMVLLHEQWKLLVLTLTLKIQL